MAEFDAEKMARTIVDEYVCQLHAAERKGLYGQIMRAFTTAHNAGLERAADIADSYVGPLFAGTARSMARRVAQAIRREIN